MTRYNTPLRYPGGKQKLAPFISELIRQNDLVGGHYAEPYAGGAGVAFELLLAEIVSHVHLNDSAIHVYAVWHSIKAHPEEFCRRIASASLNIEEWKRNREVVRHPEDNDLLDLGFSTFYLNRCNRSGILSAGVIGGLAQTGTWRIDARFPRNELIRRVEAIADKAESISVTQLDAEDFLNKHAKSHLPKKSLIYCDPPYYERAQRLYLNSYTKEDHVRLANVIQDNLAFKWVVSYDNHPDVLALYHLRKKLIYTVQYSATSAYVDTEVFIVSDNLDLPAHSEVNAIDEALAARSPE